MRRRGGSDEGEVAYGVGISNAGNRFANKDTYQLVQRRRSRMRVLRIALFGVVRLFRLLSRRDIKHCSQSWYGAEELSQSRQACHVLTYRLTYLAKEI
jgi:hypothetical protein